MFLGLFAINYAVFSGDLETWRCHMHIYINRQLIVAEIMAKGGQYLEYRVDLC